jgi:hypothetical protein
MFVLLGDVAVDGGLEVDERAEDPALEPAPGERREEALNGVEPRGAGRGEVEGPAGMACEPGAHLGVLVRGVVVPLRVAFGSDDGLNRLASWHRGLDLVEEADELLMPVALHVAADHRAIQHVQRGEQGGGAVADVVVGHRPCSALLDGKAGLGAVERLDLALFVDRQHNGMGGRIDVKAHDIAELLGELRVVGELERLHPVRRQAVGLPDALHADGADASHLGHRANAPVRRLAGRISQRQVDHALDHLSGQRRLAGLARLVAQQPVDALLHEAFLPPPDHRLGQARAAHDLGGPASVGRGDDHTGAGRVLLPGAAIRDDRFEANTIVPRDQDDNPCSHPDSFNACARSGNPPNGTVP